MVKTVYCIKVPLIKVNRKSRKYNTLQDKHIIMKEVRIR